MAQRRSRFMRRGPYSTNWVENAHLAASMWVHLFVAWTCVRSGPPTGILQLLGRAAGRVTAVLVWLLSLP